YPIHHDGIYLGNGQYVHAPRTGDVVKISAVSWSKIVGVVRPK
ncbi:MAG: hydrolase, partial [Actinobacteria bacterium]|nr:hydrolase [Actinomycetota bacterium]